MRNRIDIALAVVALLATALVWIPFLPPGLCALLILTAAAFFPGRVLVGGRGRDGAVVALSALLLSATAWALAVPLGGLALAARVAFTLWVPLGTVLYLRGGGRDPEPPLPHPVALVMVLVLALAAFPESVNHSLQTRTELRLFLPLVGALQDGSLPPTNPFLTGAPLRFAWGFAALVAPFRAIVPASAPVTLLLFQLAGLVALLAGAWRWLELRGGGLWAKLVLPALLAGGLTMFGFRHLAGLVDLDAPGLAGAPLLRAMTGLAGDPAVAGIVPLAWGASGTIWALAFAAAAGAGAEERRFRARPVLTGLLLGGSILVHPAVGIVAAIMWTVFRLADPKRPGDKSAPRRFPDVPVSIAVAIAAALPYLLFVRAPFAALPFSLTAPAPSHRWAPLVEALPLFLLAGAALAARADRRGWIAALVAGAVWGIAAPFSPPALFAFLWAALLFAGIPAALGLESVRGRLWGPPVILALVLILLATPAAMAWQALGDRSGKTHWSAEEQAMFARADRELAPETVVLTVPKPGAASEETALLSRAAYLGPQAAVDVFGAPGDSTTARLAEERSRTVAAFIAGRDPVALLDRIASDVAPRPLVFVISSEDATRHRDILDNIFPTAFRFRPLENSETLKILLYEPPEEAETTEPAPSAPRIILRPDAAGTMRADTIGTIVDTTAAAVDSAGAPAAGDSAGAGSETP